MAALERKSGFYAGVSSIKRILYCFPSLFMVVVVFEVFSLLSLRIFYYGVCGFFIEAFEAFYRTHSFSLKKRPLRWRY